LASFAGQNSHWANISTNKTAKPGVSIQASHPTGGSRYTVSQKMTKL